MALWKEPAKSPSSPLPNPPDVARFDMPDPIEPPAPAAKVASFSPESAAAPAKSASESHIAPDLVIEGKIEGAGHVRIAGRFKGDINVRGDLTIEHGAKVNGSVRAERVTIAGELTGNIETAAHVELLQTGALTGDVKSTTFSVAKGSRMRGQAEFGWDDKGGSPDAHKSNGNGHVNGNGK
ncbi:MAG TPA: polymer-forming cytoskeletal protein [Rhodanobacteraceae bacterium]|jgi:cytoskeletal protein CcmA (bactofilin family)|nr:polymer-forming cytoskeletal protein [Rhodanobacteraceae bacterium]